MKIHAGYKCDECGSKLPSWSNLQSHKRKKHPKEREKRFACPEPHCNRRYTRTKYLKQHQALFHRGERFNCNQCPQSLSSKKKLEIHKSIYHCGENSKPLRNWRPRPLNKRWTKMTDEEKKRKLAEKLAEQLSGVKAFHIPSLPVVIGEDGKNETTTEKANQ